MLFILTVSYSLLFGCDQIVNRSLNTIKKQNNTLSSSSKERSQQLGDDEKNFDSTLKTDVNKQATKLEMKHTHPKIDSNEATKERVFEIIGTNKDGPYRSGNIKRLNSDK